ncbi:MAG: EF-hand domain-containing protein [Pseudomonadota bacterium]
MAQGKPALPSLPDLMTALRCISTASLCAGLLAMAACAGAPRHTDPLAVAGGLLAVFKKADNNGDEQLTREEMSASLPQYAEHFDEIDTDHNGFVNYAELKSYLQWVRLGKEDAAEQQRMHRGRR